MKTSRRSLVHPTASLVHPTAAAELTMHSARVASNDKKMASEVTVRLYVIPAVADSPALFRLLARVKMLKFRRLSVTYCNRWCGSL